MLTGSNVISDDESEVEGAFRRVMPWLSDDFGLKDIQSAIFPGLSLVQWMAMQQQQQTPGNLMHSNPPLQNFQSQGMSIPNLQFSTKPVVTPQSTLPNQQQLPPHQIPSQQQAQVMQPHVQQQNPVPLQLPNPIQVPSSTQMQPQLQRQQTHLQQQQLQQLETIDQQKLKHNFIGPTTQPSASNHIQQHEVAKLNNINNINNNDNNNSNNNNHIVTAVKQQPALQQVMQTQLNVDYQQALLQSQQLPQLSQQEIQQIQLLQKYQQQQQQILSQLNPQHQSQILQQSQKPPEIHLPQNNLEQLKAQQFSRSQSCPSTTPPPPMVNPLSRGYQGSANLADAAAVAFTSTPMENLLQEIQSKPHSQLKPNQNSVTDLDASSASSFCLDDGPHQENFSMHAGCLGGSVVHIDTRDDNNMNTINNISNNANSIFMDGLMPDALMGRGASGKEVENFYSGKKAYMDVETEISTADISSQSFGLPDISFKPGCSSDVGLTESGIPSQGMWNNNNQTQRRTYTKVCGLLFFPCSIHLNSGNSYCIMLHLV
jgi:auxin response factor